ncbi:alanine--glyoxylate aminotransferase 2-like isoform X2 [Dysidea avara]|uniref:alanine--glyoxylate aminotransferase 2-like isoform X2 n=1 Tax=Dysidea avara TaxID=196820 RepID=UPI00331D6787
MLRKRGCCCSEEGCSSEKKLKAVGKESGNEILNGITNGVAHDRTKEETVLARRKLIASEANDLALQIADTVTGNTEHICVEGAYHGNLRSLLQLSTYKDTPMGLHSIVAPLPDVYNGKYKDPDNAGMLYAGEVKKLIDKASSNEKRISCFIMESLFSCAGQIIPPKGYLQAVYKYVHDAGGLCIADEVQVGFGRVGKYFWGFELQDVVPDIVTIGKPMGNGHPVAGVITTPEIAKRFSLTGVSYFNTYGGNPVSMAIAQAVLTVIKEENLQQHANSLGEYLLHSLLELQAKYPTHIGDVRGVGFFIGLEIVKDRKSREPDSQLATRIITRMLREHRVIMSVDGTNNNVIKFKPPMCFDKENADYLLECLEECFDNQENM